MCEFFIIEHRYRVKVFFFESSLGIANCTLSADLSKRFFGDERFRDMTRRRWWLFGSVMNQSHRFTTLIDVRRFIWIWSWRRSCWRSWRRRFTRMWSTLSNGGFSGWSGRRRSDRWPRLVTEAIDLSNFEKTFCVWATGKWIFEFGHFRSGVTTIQTRGSC